jgi:hypothetical protein
LVVGRLAGGGNGTAVLKDGAASQGQRLEMENFINFLWIIGTKRIYKAQKGGNEYK